MTDIVERLRGGVYGTNRIPLCSEAADEIARLRAECELLKRAQGGIVATLQKFAPQEIDYAAAIAHCYTTLGHAQGTKGCVAFARGAEWMRDQLTPNVKFTGRRVPFPADPVERLVRRR